MTVESSNPSIAHQCASVKFLKFLQPALPCKPCSDTDTFSALPASATTMGAGTQGMVWAAENATRTKPVGIVPAHHSQRE